MLQSSCITTGPRLPASWRINHGVAEIVRSKGPQDPSQAGTGCPISMKDVSNRPSFCNSSQRRLQTGELSADVMERSRTFFKLAGCSVGEDLFQL